LDCGPAAGRYGAAAPSRANTDVNPPSEPLSQLPSVLAGWTGSDQPIDQETRDVLGAGDFLSRIYTQGWQTAPIGLFIGYFPTQRTGQTIHSPKHCLPGAGWVFESSNYVDLTDVDGKPHRVGEYIIANGDEAVRHLLVSGAWAQRGQ
jgi:EpsI family protein